MMLHVPAQLSLVVYSVTSYVALAACVLFAVATRVQFYPVMVFLGTSKGATAVLVNALIATTVLVGYSWVALFLGRLRDAEIESAWDNMRFSVTETAFALTTFRDELNFRVGLLFVLLLFAKVFHLLNEARIVHIEQTQQTTRLTHARTVALSLTLAALDVAVINGCARYVAANGASVYLLFAFEHAVLLIALHTTVIRYAMAVYDSHYRGRWHNKGMYEMYVSLVGEALQFSAYLSFATVVLIYYGIPIHLMRQLYVSFRNLVERMAHVVRFRRLVGDLNTRFPDATPEEIAATDGVCIICRDDMTEATAQVSGVPKKLQCGHLFHSYCLQNWLERQFTCPTCRHVIPVSDDNNNAQAAAAVAAAAAARHAQPPAQAQAAAPPQANRRPEGDEAPPPLARRDDPPTPPLRPQQPPAAHHQHAPLDDDVDAHPRAARQRAMNPAAMARERAAAAAAVAAAFDHGHADDAARDVEDDGGRAEGADDNDEARAPREERDPDELLRLQLRVFKMQVRAAKATESAAKAALALAAAGGTT